MKHPPNQDIAHRALNLPPCACLLILRALASNLENLTGEGRHLTIWPQSSEIIYDDDCFP